MNVPHLTEKKKLESFTETWNLPFFTKPKQRSRHRSTNHSQGRNHTDDDKNTLFGGAFISGFLNTVSVRRSTFSWLGQWNTLSRCNFSCGGLRGEITWPSSSVLFSCECPRGNISKPNCRGVVLINGERCCSPSLVAVSSGGDGWGHSGHRRGVVLFRELSCNCVTSRTWDFLWNCCYVWRYRRCSWRVVAVGCEGDGWRRCDHCVCVKKEIRPKDQFSLRSAVFSF